MYTFCILYAHRLLSPPFSFAIVYLLSSIIINKIKLAIYSNAIQAASIPLEALQLYK